MKTTKFIKSLLVLVGVLMMSVTSQMLAWNTTYLIGDPIGGWSKNSTYSMGSSDANSKYFYFAKNNYFAFYIDYYNYQIGPGTNGAGMTTGDGGQKFTATNTSNSAKYTGNNGIVEVHVQQKDNGDNTPWVWLTRPSVQIKHNWNGTDGSWTAHNMTDNNNGTYSYIGNYSGSNATNCGVGSGEATMKYFTTATLVGSPAVTNRCIFEYNASGYKGFGSQSQNTGSLIITKLCSVSYDGNGNTSGSVPSTQSDKKYGVSFSLATNTGSLAKTGYTLTGWNTANDGSGTHYALGASFTPSNISTTLYAEWTQTITVNVNGGDDAGSISVCFNAGTLKSFTAATRDDWVLDSYWTSSDNSGSKIIDYDGEDATLVSNISGYTNSDGKWTRTAATTLYAHWKQTYRTVYNANFPAGVATSGTVPTDATEYNSGESVTVKSNSGSLTATGYTFVGWNTLATGLGTDYAASGSATFTISANTTLFAKWSENMTTVNLVASPEGAGSFTCGGDPVTSISAGVTTHPSVTAVPASGYYLTGTIWTKDNNNITLSATNTAATNITGCGTAETSTTLTATFEPDKKIYFDNSHTKWANVYVYLFSNDVWWNDGEQGVHPQVNRVAYGAMTKVEGEDNLYEFAYHTSSVNYTFSHVAFSENDQHNYTALYGTKAAYRGDWRESMPIYVAPSTSSTTNNTKYHSDGYWMMKETVGGASVGYALYSTSKVGDFLATSTGAHTASITLRYDDTSDKTYYINNIASQNYSLSHTFISSDNGKAYDIYHYNDVIKFTVRPTSVGLYTITLEQGQEHMKVSVQYPVQTGDRRLVYSYTSGGTKYRYTDVIRAAETSAITSMYIDKDQTGAALKMQRCTGFDGVTKKPIWSDVSGTTGWISYFSSKAKGVYVITVNFAGTNDVSSTLSDIEPYSGDYYIKTDCADGGWANYKQNAMHENTINYNTSDPLKFNYYFCQWVGNTTTNVKCVIANEYNNAISDTLVSDDILTRSAIKYETLPYAANVRFSYNSATNELKRTYLLGSADANSFLYIVPKAAGYVYATDGSTDLNGSKRKFTDIGNWTYQMDVKAYPTAQAGVITEYPTVEPIVMQTLVPTENVLIGGDTKGSTKYDIKLVYDFKTDYLMSAWVPTANIPDAIKDVDVMLIRHRQDAGTAITFNGGSLNAKKMIGAIQIDYSDMVGNVSSWNSTTRPLLKYFISFPFDVNVNDVFGLNSAYGDAYVIQKYNGAKRAEKGFFRGDGTTTFWEDLTRDSVMHANEGYCVILDNDYFNSNSYHIWDNKTSGSSIHLYFPSTGNVGDIESTNKTINIPAHECKIDRTFNNGKRELNHKNTDSHWNMMGVPIFNNHTGTEVSGTPGAVFVTTGDTAVDCHYFYAWSSADNYFRITAAKDYTFKAMHSYLVQYTGNVTFTGSAPASVAARRTPAESYKLELQVSNSENDILNHAFVELREEACDTFALNEDVYMSGNNAAANIYTFAGNYDVAANVLSIGNHTIPVGLEVRTAGTYSISMPSSFNGTAILFDKETGVRTNLAISDYEVALPKGVVDDRFELEISDISTVITDIEYTTGEGSLKDGQPHKFVKNGLLYIVRDGKMYDARGARVE